MRFVCSQHQVDKIDGRSFSSVTKISLIIFIALKKHVTNLQYKEMR